MSISREVTQRKKMADEVLSRPETLKREEWKIVNRLPGVGYRIAESSEQLKPIAGAFRNYNKIIYIE